MGIKRKLTNDFCQENVCLSEVPIFLIKEKSSYFMNYYFLLYDSILKK